MEKKVVNFRENLREYWSFLKNYKWSFIFLLIIVFFTQAFQTLTSFLFKYLVDYSTRFVAGDLALKTFINILLIIAGVFFVSEFLQALGYFCRHYFTGILDSNVIMNLKNKYFNHIIGLDHRFHVTHKTGSLISRLGRGALAIENLNDAIIMNFAPLFFQVFIVGASLIYFDVYAALSVLITLLVFIGYSYYIQKKQLVARKIFNEAEDYEKGKVSDFFTNIESIKFFGKEKYTGKKFSEISNSTKVKSVKYWRWFGWYDFGQITILAIGTLIILYFSLKSFLSGQITLGTVVFIYTVYGNITGAMSSFTWGMRSYFRSLTDIQDLFKYGKIEKEIKDKAEAKNLRIIDGEIEFDNITFNYGKRKLFCNFNLRIPANKKVAFVGHSGCGKTTLVKLLYRFYDVQKGGIKIDGVDIKDLKQESLRSEMSIVPQEAILFDDTIYNNIAFSKPSASRDEVKRAIRFAQLDKFIMGLPEKENTIVGERGVKLSGGEKQRVSIARAILANKKILVLDEATSSLDSQTEHEIQRDLEKLMQGKTSIIIAHRLSTIMKADIIVVMEKGKIVQMGTHERLIRRSGTYKQLWNLQKGGYIKE